MKNSKLIVLFAFAGLLTACGGSSGGGKSVKNSSDINKAKNLVTEFKTKKQVFSIGYVSPQSVSQNINFAANNSGSSKLYAMQNVGCLDASGDTHLSNQIIRTTADLIVGANSHKVVYFQENDLTSCYSNNIFGVGFDFSISFGATFGIGTGSNNSLGQQGHFGQIPSNVCQNLSITAAVVRRDHTTSTVNTNQDYWNTNSYSYNNYTSIGYDSYYLISQPNFSQSYFGPADEDSFAAYGSGEAVFVSESARIRANSQCVKDIFYGKEITPGSLPPIQILRSQDQIVYN